MTPTILRMLHQDASTLARATKAHADRGHWTPTIAGAGISIVDGKIQAFATDRYTCVRVRVPHFDVDGDGKHQPAEPEWRLDADTVIVPRDALVWLADALKRSSAVNELVTFEIRERTKRTTVIITVADPLVGLSLAGTFAAEHGKYPPLERLFADHKPGAIETLTVSPRLLARARAGISPDGRVEITAGAENEHGKPGPLYFRALGTDPVELDGLIQPHHDREDQDR